jgi:hypothetical protein
MMSMTPWGWGAPRQPVFERLEFPTNDQVDSSFSQQSAKPINVEKPTLKGEIEMTTTDNVIRIGTSRVKLGGEFNRLIVIDDQVDTVMEDVAPDCKKEKVDKVVDSKYLQPRWCPPSLTRTQKRKLQRLRLAEMREKEREKRRDELFNEIKPMTLPKQEWRRKDAPQRSTAKPTAAGQTATPSGQTTADSVPGGQTTPSGGQTAQAQEAHGLTEDEADPTAALSSPHTKAGS